MSKDGKPIRVVIVGAGFGGVYAFRRLHDFFHRRGGVSLILVNSRNYFLFTPLLHEVATGGVSRENVVEPLRKILGCCLDEFYLADVKKIELRGKRVITTRGDLSYDYLILAPGAETNFYDTPGAKEHSFELKSLEDAVRLKNHFIEKFEEAFAAEDSEKLDVKLRFVVVGGGPTGVELAAEMAELFHETFGKYYRNNSFRPKVKIILLQNNEELLPQLSKRMRKKSLEILLKKNIDVRLGVRAVLVGESFIELGGGERIPSETVIWVAGARPRALSFSEDAEKNARGRIIVNEYLQMLRWPDVFVLGDAAAFSSGGGRELPMLAQVAVKEAAAAAENVKNLIERKPLRPFRYRHTADLVSLGQWMAVAEIKKIFFWGHISWWFWRTVYLSKIISFPKKIKVAVDWTINLFMPRDISEL